jgi:hypothetical protein
MESWNPNYIKKVARKTSSTPHQEPNDLTPRKSTKWAAGPVTIGTGKGLFLAASLSQERNGPVLSARKEQRVPEGRTLDHFA